MNAGLIRLKQGLLIAIMERRPQSPPPYTPAMAAPSPADDVLTLLFAVAAASPALRCSPSGTPSAASLAALRPLILRDDAALTLLVFAARSADLLLVSHGRLSLSPSAAAWARAPHPDRVDALRTAVFAHPLSTHRWRTARLPGWRLLPNLPPLDVLCPAGASASPRSIARRIGRLASDLTLSDSHASSPLALAAALAHAHALLAPRRTRPRRSLSLRAVFEDDHHRTASFSTTCAFPAAHVFLDLAVCADLVAPDSLLIHPPSIARALTLGLSASQILLLLERSLPSVARTPAFDAAVRRDGRTHGRLHLHELLILEARSPADLDAALRARRARAAVSRTLSPRAVVVDRRAAPALRRRLRAIPGFVDSSLDSSLASTDALSPHVHLYLAARIAHALPDLVPLPLRTPHALVDLLHDALSPAERDLADQAFAAWQASLADRPLPASWNDLDSPAPESLEPAARDALERCTDALHSGRSLQFEYLGRDDAALTTRTVDPLRIEWRRSLPYLVAFDLNTEEERTFRIDRITRFLAPPR